jgi:hypothetical protein
VARLEQRNQRAGTLDGLLGLLEVGLRTILTGRRGQARLARAEVDERHERLQEDIVDLQTVHLGLDLPDLLFGELLPRRLAHLTFSSAVYVACVSSTHCLKTS